MKKVIVAVLVFVTLYANAQEASVEKSLFSAQFGLISVNINHEAKLARKLVLHSELGSELWYGTIDYVDPSIQDETVSLFVPYLALEPRYYYNIDNRLQKGKKIVGNSANYIALLSKFVFNKSPISTSNSNFETANAFLIIPKFGIRRTFSKHFNYEFAFGVGIQNNIVGKNEVCNCSKSETTYDLQARIGYNF